MNLGGILFKPLHPALENEIFLFKNVHTFGNRSRWDSSPWGISWNRLLWKGCFLVCLGTCLSKEACIHTFGQAGYYIYIICLDRASFQSFMWQNSLDSREWLLWFIVAKIKQNHLSQTAAAAAKSFQSCPTLCDPIDGSPPGSPVPGILQARTLQWGAISFSSAWKWKVKVKLLGCVRLFVTPWAAAYQAPPSMGFSRQEYWSGMPLPLRYSLLNLISFK